MNWNLRRLMQIGFLLVFPLILCACSSTKVRQHPDFKSRIEAERTALLLPPQVEIHLQTSGGTTRVSEEEAKATQDLNTMVAAELSKRGFNVISGQYQIDIKDNLAIATTAQEMCQRLSGKLYWQRLPEPEALAYKFTLGPEVASLAKPDGVNSLVFMRFHIWKRSAGDNAAEFAGKLLLAMGTLGIITQPKDPSGAVILQATLVDAATGDVLWGNEIEDSSYTPIGTPAFQDNIEGMTADLFKPFPQL